VLVIRQNRFCFSLLFILLVDSCSNSPSAKVTLNDIHSQLNETSVDRVYSPKSVQEVQAIVRAAKALGTSISISGGKHSMGGQQFGKNTTHINMTAFNRILNFDAKNGVIEVESGVEWPELIQYLWERQADSKTPWGIIQKQTGADRLTIGGAISSNIHGRGLTFRPFITDVESFQLVDANGDLKICNRKENPELFRLAAGGYGLFGIITQAKIRLSPRVKLKRVVKIADVNQVPKLFRQRIKEGYLYGDFQYSTDETSPKFLKAGVFSTYLPVASTTPIAKDQKEISKEGWTKFYELGHFDKAKAFKAYSDYYMSTSGQIYWSDTHQLSIYVDNYHELVDKKNPVEAKATEMITEVYVPRDKLPQFMEQVKGDFLENKTNVFYGTIRLIEKDSESFLAWAKESYACVIFNLHVVHTDAGIEKAKLEFRGLIDRALSFGGSYFLTYHRWATKDQVLKAYPQFVEFLKAKKKYDPQERFQSDWYRHYRDMFSNELKHQFE
jgi:FAD/FMN-containing dehydrogenase